MMGGYLLILLSPRPLPVEHPTLRVHITFCSPSVHHHGSAGQSYSFQKAHVTSLSSPFCSLRTMRDQEVLGDTFSTVLFIAYINFSHSDLNPSGQILQGTLIRTLYQQDSCSTLQNYPASQPSFLFCSCHLCCSFRGLVIPVTPLVNDLNTTQIFPLVFHSQYTHFLYSIICVKEHQALQFM